VARFYGAVRSDSAYGVNIRWPDPATVRVEYLAADEAEQLHDRVALAGEDIRVALQPGIYDSIAAGGGMLYNRQRNGH